jgi:O-antigen ligase
MVALWTAEIRKKLATVADIFAVAIVVSLPWSTSATAILIGLWFLTLVPVLRWDELRREILTPAGGLPVLLLLLGVAGMLWADVTLLERWKGLDSFLKLAAIPLLLVQFHRSERGTWVFAGYLLSCIALLVVTSIVIAVPPLAATFLHFDNVIVKNAATQSGEFVTCIFGLLFLATEAAERRSWTKFFVFFAVIIGMLASILYVATGRTALVVALALLIVFAARRSGAKGPAIVFSGAMLVGVIGWTSSPYLRERTTQIWSDLKQYEAAQTVTSSGERLVFWTKSLAFISQAPVIGQGTGTIRFLYEKSAVGQAGAASEVSTNPHNQTFAVGIQLGLVGVAVLWAMWISHLMLFRGAGLAAWVGLIVVVQNVVGSLFNSHLFDFTQGWTYVIGFGIAGGTVLKTRTEASQK